MCIRDRDGDVDIISASAEDDKVAWYENSGSESFTAYTISTSVDGVTYLAASDIDQDGDIDIVSASKYDDKISWFENNGSQSFTANTVATSADEPMSVAVADMDGDGDIDIVSASKSDNTVAWYENDGAADPSFSATDIITNVSRPKHADLADVDSDGDMDIIVASQNDDQIRWIENNNGNASSWTARDISTQADAPQAVFAADIDGDGDIDIVSASKNDDRIAWHENDGASDPSFFHEYN